jgi:hypothetical protein
MRKPINPIAHQFLTDQGAAVLVDQIEADFDDGDPENGPGTWGHPECDVYQSESHNIGIDWRGMTHEPRDFAMEEFADEMAKHYESDLNRETENYLRDLGKRAGIGRV